MANSQILGLAPQSQIRKFLIVVPVHKSQNSQIFMLYLLSQNSPKSSLLDNFCDMYVFELGHYMLYLRGEKVCILGHAKFHLKFANHKKDWIRKSQMCKMSHLRKVRKSNKFVQVRKFADLRTAHLC
jgi:hypothetical protein